MKRVDKDELTNSPRSKRCRIVEADNAGLLSSLSDEILLHIFSFLSIPSLIVCQRLSRRFYELSGDSELWKRLYYSRWVLPRIRHLPYSSKTSSRLGYSPKVSEWFGHSHLAVEGKARNWKRQYRLRHNWSRGICQVSKVEVSQPPRPPVVVELHAGVVFTADRDNGLRAWSAKNPTSFLSKISFYSPAAPTALSATQGSSAATTEIIVGFEDGHYEVYDLSAAAAQFTPRCSHAASTSGAVTAVASSPPYLLMISLHKVLSVYKLPIANAKFHRVSGLPRLLASLEANNVLAPISLSIRISSSEIIASIAYSFSRIGSGWSLGIQELRLSQDGVHKGSRLATTVESQYNKGHTYSSVSSMGTTNPRQVFDNTDYRISMSSAEPSIQYHEPPTSVSYSHPYLLASHGDNTLTVYLVESTSELLAIKRARRLWGHTSSVLGAQVSDRGRAVSMSSHGGELRIWELESVVSFPPTSQRALRCEASVQVSPENQPRAAPEESTPQETAIQGPREVGGEPDNVKRARVRGLVGFDEEQVVVLRAKGAGAQLLECYDFT